MGLLYEVNLYLVVTNQEDIEPTKEQNYISRKDGKRIYPIGISIPLIMKSVGCVAMIRVLNFKVDNNSTTIEYIIEKEFDKEDEIAKHYYKMYLDSK